MPHADSAWSTLLRYLHEDFEPIAGVGRFPHQALLIAVTIVLLLNRPATRRRKIAGHEYLKRSIDTRRRK